MLLNFVPGLTDKIFKQDKLKFRTMKTKILLLALAILGSSLAFSQPVEHESKTDCEKKVLNKIKKKMMYLDVKDYLVEGEKQGMIITCALNDQNVVEVVKISGYDEELKVAIQETLKEHPAVCKTGSAGEQFTFKMVLYHRPA